MIQRVNTSIWTWCNHVTCDIKSKAAFLQNETRNLPSPHNTTRLKFSLQSMYDLFLFSSLSFFSFIDFQTDIYRQEIIFILPKPTSGSNVAHYIPEYYYVMSKFRKSH